MTDDNQKFYPNDVDSRPPMILFIDTNDITEQVSVKIRAICDIFKLSIVTLSQDASVAVKKHLPNVPCLGGIGSHNDNLPAIRADNVDAWMNKRLNMFTGVPPRLFKDYMILGQVKTPFPAKHEDHIVYMNRYT